MSFGDPRALWLLTLAPVGAAVAYWLWRRRLRSLASWAATGLWHRLELFFDRRRVWLSAALLFVTLFGSAFSLARPRWGTLEQRVERQGVDIVFVLDSSLSMEARDVAPSRMGIAKTLVRRMVADLPGHRVALVQAEGERVVLAPLTVDTAVIDLVLDAVFAGSLPNPGTRLAPALRQSLELFPPESERHRVMVLLSDGEDHGGGWDPLLDRLREEHVIVHTLGIGSTAGGPIPLPGDDGDTQYKRDERGQIVTTKLEEAALQRLSEATGGIYLAVERASVDPDPILEAIGEMEKRTFDGEVLNLQAERFQWPLFVAVLALVGLLASSPFAARISPPHEGER